MICGEVIISVVGIIFLIIAIIGDLFIGSLASSNACGIDDGFPVVQRQKETVTYSMVCGLRPAFSFAQLAWGTLAGQAGARLPCWAFWESAVLSRKSVKSIRSVTPDRSVSLSGVSHGFVLDAEACKGSVNSGLVGII